MKFLGQNFQKLEYEQDRHTNKCTQTRPNTLSTTFAGGKYNSAPLQ